MVLCQVCSSPTKKHLFYGGQVCESCRGFFRRSVQGGRKRPPPGNRGSCGGAAEPCVIDSKNRKSCARCRYRRCLEAGMRPELVNSAADAADAVGAGAMVVAGRRYQRRSRWPQPLVGCSPVLMWTEEEESTVRAVVERGKERFYEVMATMLLEDLWPMDILCQLLVSRESMGPQVVKNMEQVIHR